MRLARIKLAGFKSFVDPTVIPLSGPLIGVVGPNGCGKSNVIDAVRWVLGERSARQLRGGASTDVIFNGSAQRKPVGRASVELVFDNSDGRLEGEYARYSEISVRRELTRDGTSTFYLNGTRCRRRDVVDLFLGTGLGPRSYAIIEQGTVSRLIEARPEELRAYLEEAAGISRYKERRREAMLRLRHTRDNLERLADVRTTLAEQVASLARQAQTARRYRSLCQEERRLQAERLALRYRALAETLQGHEQRLASLEAALREAEDHRQALSAEADAARERRTAAARALDEAQSGYYRLQANMARREEEVSHLRTMAARACQEQEESERRGRELDDLRTQEAGRLAQLDTSLTALETALSAAQRREVAAETALHEAEQHLQAWQSDWEQFGRRLAAAERSVEVERARHDQEARAWRRLKERADRLQGERARADTPDVDLPALQAAHEDARQAEQAAARQAAAAEAALQQAREALSGRVEVAAQARDRLYAIDSRTQALQAAQEVALGKDRAQAAASGGADAGVPRLAECLQVESGWEAAVETVLGRLLQARQVPELTPEVITSRQAEEAGLPLFETTADAVSPPGPAETLAAKVQAPAGLSELLAQVHLVEDLPTALARRQNLPSSATIVTRAGLWLGPHWLYPGAETTGSDGILARERALQEARAERESAAEALAVSERDQAAARAALTGAEQTWQDARAALNAAQRHLQAAGERLATARSRVERHQALVEHLQAELRETEAQLAQASGEHRETEARLAAAEQALAALQTEEAARSAEGRTRRDAQQAARTALHEHRHTTQAHAMRKERETAERQAAEQRVRQLDTEYERLIAHQAALAEAAAQAQGPVVVAQEQLAALREDTARAEQELGAQRRTLEQAEAALEAGTRAVAEQEDRVRGLRGDRDAVRLESEGDRVRRQTLLEQFQEADEPLDQVLARLPAQADETAWSKRIETVAERIRRIGAVNLAAEAEHQERLEEQRHLDAQHQDLTEAIEALEQAIWRIDRETRARLRETFERVNASLQHLFPRLIGGGEARLEGMGDDPLEAELAIMARPPGKRPAHIQQLSGGEKALAAVALVFALFELNPAPFCLLDEVDAPLDDANVGRFGDLLRELSDRVQFIFITHNKVTMEMADRLTGVTMREAGVSRIVTVDVAEAVRLAAV